MCPPTSSASFSDPAPSLSLPPPRVLTSASPLVLLPPSYRHRNIQPPPSPSAFLVVPIKGAGRPRIPVVPAVVAPPPYYLLGREHERTAMNIMSLCNLAAHATRRAPTLRARPPLSTHRPPRTYPVLPLPSPSSFHTRHSLPLETFPRRVREYLFFSFSSLSLRAPFTRVYFREKRNTVS